MKTADEMFEELGYKKYDNHPEEDEKPEANKWVTQDCRVIEYKQSETINGEFYTLYIRFHIVGKRVEIGVNKRPEDIRTMSLKLNPILNSKELQAINKKVEELRMGKIVQIPKIICEECKKREATRLCDYEIGHNIDLAGPGKVKIVTCDKKLCVECATKINNKDYCKKHIKALKQELGGVLNERK